MQLHSLYVTVAGANAALSEALAAVAEVFLGSVGRAVLPHCFRLLHHQAFQRIIGEISHTFVSSVVSCSRFVLIRLKLVFVLAVIIIVQIGAALGLRLGLFLLEDVERCTAAQRDDQQDDEDAAHAALFLRFLGGGFCRLSGDFWLCSLPTHSVMLTAQTGQDVLTAPATHLVVQEQVAGVSSSPVSAIRSASST